ncbi:MAG: ATP-grasp fold amidoligase family protein [Pseudomonadales bacterium]|nr:ATP-grasp fold amidoligase family protein [Pseudomonadales bacterium]
MIASVVILVTNRRATLHFRKHHGRLPRVAPPRTYADRLFWRKVVDHSPRFVELSDKLAVKDYIRRTCPELRTPETLWNGEDADAIPDALLAGDVFVKANHGSGENYRIRNGVVDRAELKRLADFWLVKRHGYAHFEWSYTRIEPRLFVERAVGDAEVDLLEINIRASGGRALLGSIIGRNKLPGMWVVYLDPEGRPSCGPGDEDDAEPAPLPADVSVTEAYRQAVRYAEILSAGIDYARFDFLWNGHQLYGGEITLYPAAGLHEIEHAGVRERILAGWRLQDAHFLCEPQRGVRRLYANALRRRLSQSTGADH